MAPRVADALELVVHEVALHLAFAVWAGHQRAVGPAVRVLEQGGLCRATRRGTAADVTRPELSESMSVTLPSGVVILLSWPAALYA